MKAIFPGSFDPLTNGHLSLIKRASRLFDTLDVIVMTNPNKTTWWTAEERCNMIQQVIKTMPNVFVRCEENRLAMDVAMESEAVIIKGLRHSQDMIYEYPQAMIQLEHNVETLFLMTSQEESIISSTMVKELAQFGGDYAKYVPNNIADALKKKVK